MPHPGMMPAFANMMPPFMYGPRGPGPGGRFPAFPPNYHPSMGPRPPYPYPAGPGPDQRFRGHHPGGPPRHMGPPREGREGSEDDDRPGVKRTAIIKDQDLKQFDDILRNDSSWAAESGDIDYRYEYGNSQVLIIRNID